MQQHPTPSSPIEWPASSQPLLPVRPLAGLASDAGAAAGLSVEETVALLLRYAWIEKRAMEVALHWLCLLYTSRCV